MPAHDGLGFHNDQEVLPARPEPGEGNPEEPARMGQGRAWVCNFGGGAIANKKLLMSPLAAGLASFKDAGPPTLF
jgi:hypothetical protein